MRVNGRGKIYVLEVNVNPYLSLDAQNMGFTDGFFDKIAAMYIASVVPNPHEMVSEMKCVCKPEDDLLILNHFSNCNRLIRASETILSPLASTI